jgi:hypothetical protein
MADNEQAIIEHQRVQKYAEILVESGTVSIFEKKIKEIKGLKVLKDSDIKAIFTKAGITIEGTNNIESWLPPIMEDNELNDILSKLEILKKQKDKDGQVSDKIMNLYHFAAYVQDDLPNLHIYENKDSSELLTIIEQQSIKYIKGTTDYAHAWNDLCFLAKTKIFDSEEHNRRYKNSLDYLALKEELSEGFKLLTDDDKRLSSIAELQISKICGKGYNQKEAIALYNRIVGLIKKNPYIPEQSAVIIKCDKCGSINRFNSFSEAEKGNCGQCKVPLFMVCPSCSKKTPASADYCVHCHFLIAGIKNFNIYYQKSIDALAIYDFVEAKKQMANAKLANPKDTRLPGLEKQINTASAEFEKPIQEISNLINQKKLKTALKTLYSVKIKYPSLNLSSYEKDLTTKIARLDKMFIDSKSSPQTKQIEVCEKIIIECLDHDDAIAFLRSIPPKPCGDISLVCDEQDASINVSWIPSTDKNITYTLVRKENGVPATPNDKNAVILTTDSNQLMFSDNNVVSGKAYGYAVFSKRFGIYSTGKSAQTVLSQEVSNLKYTATPQSNVVISWDIPKNCSRVIITRSEGSIPTANKNTAKLFNSLGGSFTDKGLKVNCMYGYRIQTVYTTQNGDIVSSGLTFTYKIEEQLKPFVISVEQKKLNLTVSWKELQNGYSVRLVELKNDINVNKDKIVSVTDITKYGKVIASASSENTSITVNLAEYKSFDLIAFAYLSEKAISSNSVPVNTYLPLSLKSKKPRIDNNNLIFSFIEPINADAKYIYYGLTNSTPYWMLPENISNQQKISIESYRKHKNELFINNINNLSGTCYLTLFTEYNINGRIVLSSPDKEKIKIPMQIKIQYGVKVKNNRSALDVTLNVRVIKGQITKLPSLCLVVIGSNSTVININDIKLDSNNFTITKTYKNLKLPPNGTKIRLLPEDSTYLEDMSFNCLNWFKGEI